MSLAASALAAASGGVVGFSLGLVGGGGSILAVPLMVYAFGIANPHQAIGTSALAVAANAALGLANHARAGRVQWRAGLPFAAAGIAGAALGSTLGKAVDGQHLLFLFALLMIAVGILMLRRRTGDAATPAAVGRREISRLVAIGFGAGATSGFFGIGGGFLIVPGLIAGAGLGMLQAVATSLVAVTAFGLTTAFSYALSGLVLWPIAGLFVAGGLAGSVAGSRVAIHLADRGLLTRVFAGLIFLVAGYMLWRSASALWG